MKKPQVKRVHQPTALPDHRIHLGAMQFGVASELTDDEDGSIERLLTLLDGTRTTDQVLADFAETHSQVDEQSVREVIDGLAEGGFLEDAHESVTNLSSQEFIRYEPSRHFFAWIDSTPRTSPYEVQSALKNASVSLLGVGGTGTAVAAGLVAGGIGSLRLADFDRIEESNLTRQLLFSEEDMGAPKVDSAVDRLRRMNSHVNISGTELRATGPQDISGLMADCDLFVLCADEPNPDIMQWTNEAALKTGTPWFMSFYTGPMAVVGSFVPGESGCWECVHRKEIQREHRAQGRQLLAGRRPNAVVAASANIGGHLCALEIQYYLGGFPSQTRDRIFHWNLADWDHSYSVATTQDPDCPACGIS